MKAFIHKVLYRTLSLEGYLRTVSRMFFLWQRLGIGRYAPATEYVYHLPRLVREGDTAIDIGANLGYYSRTISRLVGTAGKVYAVEPVPPIVNVLRRNLHQCRNVEILPYALGTEDKQIAMANDSALATGYFGTGQNFVSEKSGGCSGGDRAEDKNNGRENESSGHTGCKGSKAGSSNTKTNSNCRRHTTGNTDDATNECSGAVEFTAQMRCGSELFAALERLDFIKCDIEGYEVIVMEEIRPLLEQYRPTVLIETGGDNRRLITELFTSLGYEGFTLDRGREVPLTGGTDKDIIFRYAH